MSWETVVGLEVHVQLNTHTKAFCDDVNEFGSESNTRISPISLAHPGTLPRINHKQILSTVKLGLAFGSEINKVNYFDRKNYFYPDLPKGYQITQDERPICIGGTFNYVMGDGTCKSVRIHHLHMEEDAGKSIHDLDPNNTLLDFNRAGVPLIEIVTEPDLRSSDEVYYFIQGLQQLVRSINISDGNMEEGSFRCDCNVSVKLNNEDQLGERCEIKNLNSKRFAKAAIEYEAARQIKLIEGGNKIIKTTMLFNPSSGKTYPMRDKEEVNDYRYFNDPDLPPIQISDQLIDQVKAEITELPFESYQRLTNLYDISHQNANVIVDNLHLVELFNAIIPDIKEPKEVAQLIVNKISPWETGNNTEFINNTSNHRKIKEFLTLITDGKISKSAAYNQLFDVMMETENKTVAHLAEQLHLIKEEDQSFTVDIAQEIVAAFPDKVKAYRNGKKGLIGFFMGQAMKKTKGKADPKLLQKEIEALLKS